MESKPRDIQTDEVVSIIKKDDNMLMNHQTYKAKEFLEKFKNSIAYGKAAKWLSEGVDCEILSPNQREFCLTRRR